jgi:hypothetical protein
VGRTKDVGRLEGELARKLRSPLIQKVYVEHWQTLEACEAVFSYKQMEQRRKRQCSQVEKVIKGGSNIRNRVGQLARD